MGTNKDTVRCVDCEHAGPRVNIVCRCKILLVGKVGNAKRKCDYFTPKNDGNGQGK